MHSYEWPFYSQVDSVRGRVPAPGRVVALTRGLSRRLIVMSHVAINEVVPVKAVAIRIRRRR